MEPTPHQAGATGGAASGRLGRHTLGDKLGEGGMGQVWQAHDPQLEREVAIKVLRGDPDPWMLSKFLAEARLTGWLEHPNIVPVHELCHDGAGPPYFTMKRIEGRDLATVLDRERTSGERARLAEKLGVFLKICDAVGYAHSKGVLHRDLKPANVMLGAFGEVLVCDWGLCTMTNDERRMTNRGDGSAAPLHTQVGTVLGTPAYMAPEQAEGRIDELDARSDIYSLGAVLYEMLVLEPPFEGDDVTELLGRIRRGELLPPSQRASRPVPWELEAVVLKAMAHRQDERYPDVASLQRDVQAFLDDRLLEAPRYSAAQRAGKWLRAHRQRIVAAVALVAVLSLCGAGGRWWLLERRRRDAFEHHARAARAARARGDWPAVETAAGLALQQREDAGLRRLLDAARARRAEQLARLRAERELQRELEPLLAEIAAARPLLYVPAIRFDRRLAGVRRAVEQVARLTARPEYAGQARLWRKLGEAQLLIGQERQAERSLKRALGLQAAAPGAAAALGVLYLRRSVAALLGSGRDARRRRSARSLAFNREARRWLAAAGLLDDQSLQSAIARAYQAVAAREPVRAIEIAEAALARYPAELGSEELWIALGLAREDDSSLGCLDRAIARCPNHAWAHLLRSLFQTDDVRRRADLDRALELNPALVQALVNRGALRMSQGDTNGARTDLDCALELDPDDALAWLDRGALWLRLGQPRRAIADANRALALAPRLALALSNRSRAQAKLGRLDLALADLDRAVALEPDSALWYNDRGAARHLRHDLPGALADFDRAVRLDPAYGLAWSNRALVHAALGRRDLALADCRQAMLRAPRLADPYLLRARLLQQQGDLNATLADLDRAIERAPRTVPLIWRGALHALRGDRNRAEADLQRAMAVDPDSPYAALWLSGLDGRTARLERYVAQSAWTTAIVRHYLGRTTAAELANKLRERPDRLCEALGFIGLFAERRGDLAAARAAYRACLATGAANKLQHNWARFRLPQLK